MFFCALFSSGQKKQSKEEEQRFVVVVDHKHDEREYKDLCSSKVFFINRWRQTVHDELPSVGTLIPVEHSKPIDDEYNERAWKWFESDFARDPVLDFLHSETIYQTPQFFTEQLAKKNRK